MFAELKLPSAFSVVVHWPAEEGRHFEAMGEDGQQRGQLKHHKHHQVGSTGTQGLRPSVRLPAGAGTDESRNNKETKVVVIQWTILMITMLNSKS